MENTNTNILKWDDSFTQYCNLEKKCIEGIGAIGEIKNNLKKIKYFLN